MSIESRPAAPAAVVSYPERWINRLGEPPANLEARIKWIELNIRSDETERRA